ncbi:hypothetical protein AFK71_02825 [Virgibacillus pantothenticus]|uniref:Transposase n=1 Tax=Virgibacillus pantothenticus TaxID=1473 RepID=A0A0L0QU78_VIRPA|nr:hypothetical protein AFK71_02825 [Virgibacillus pantothenticus]
MPMHRKMQKNTLTPLSFDNLELQTQKVKERERVQYHLIIDLLGIKDKQVEVWDIKEEPATWLVELYTKVKKQTCPSCKAKTKRVHSYRKQLIQGSNLIQLKLD